VLRAGEGVEATDDHRYMRLSCAVTSGADTAPKAGAACALKYQW
jgi:hypothetical protein